MIKNIGNILSTNYTTQPLNPQSNLPQQNLKHVQPSIASAFLDQNSQNKMTNKVWKKAKEAEDLPIFKKIKRSNSLPLLVELSKMELKKEACEARSGVFWKCIDRKPHKHYVNEKTVKPSGYIYKFRARKKYNNYSSCLNETKFKTEQVDKTNAEIFPAVEPSPLDLMNCLRLRHFEGVEKHFGFKINHKDSSVFIELPDPVALTALLEEYHYLHGLKQSDVHITSSKGIATDLEFTFAHFKGGVVSDSQEFVHDNYVHILQRLLRLLWGTQYYNQTEQQLIQGILSLYAKIYMAKKQNPILEKETKKLNFLLGVITDIVFTFSPSDLNSTKNLNALIKWKIETVWDTPSWKKCAQSRFPIDTPTTASMIRLWDQVEQEAEAFLRIKKRSKLTGDFEKLSKTMQELVYTNFAIFLKLDKAGIFIEDLAKVNEIFLRWILKNSDRFLILKEKGLSIIGLSNSEENIIIKHSKDIITALNHTPLKTILSFENQF